MVLQNVYTISNNDLEEASCQGFSFVLQLGLLKRGVIKKTRTRQYIGDATGVANVHR